MHSWGISISYSTMGDQIERPTLAKGHQKLDVFDKIEQVQNLLKKEPLSAEDQEQIVRTLHEITEETERREGRFRSFFRDDVVAKLKILLPEEVIRDHPFFQKLEEQGEFIDSIDLLVDGECFNRIIEKIRTARSSIMIKMFIWRDDNVGNRIAEELLQAADRGVQITIMKDDLGTVFEKSERGKQSFLGKSGSPMERAKAEIVDRAYTNPLEAKSKKQKQNPLADQILHHPNIVINRNVIHNPRSPEYHLFTGDHTKLYIFDDETIITGGVNIGDEYNAQWHDYMVEMQSKVLVERFTNRRLGGKTRSEGTSIEFGMNVVNDTVKQLEIKPTILNLLSRAETEVVLEMAYFGDPDITQKIVETANKNVHVTIILPAQANVQDDLNKKVVKGILEETKGKNVDVYYYPRMLHAKVVHVDGKYTFLGSANLNKQATEQLGETNILVADSECNFTRELRLNLQQDIRDSRKINSPSDINYSAMKAYVESKS